jgi:hypothetical protein
MPMVKYKVAGSGTAGGVSVCAWSVGLEVFVLGPVAVAGVAVAISALILDMAAATLGWKWSNLAGSKLCFQRKN